MGQAKVESQQIWQAEKYAEEASFVYRLAYGLIDILSPQAQEKILDLGCGEGSLTEKIAQSGATVWGVDTSESMLAQSRAKGLQVRALDGQKLDYYQEFDAVFSNAAIHWMHDKQAVAQGVYRALKPHGRFVGEFGGFGNIAAITTALKAVARLMGGQEELAKAGDYISADTWRKLLSQAGFHVISAELIPRPTPLPDGMRSWLEVFRAPFFAQFGQTQEGGHGQAQEGDHGQAQECNHGQAQERAYELAQSLLATSLKREDGLWFADYVRLRFVAHKD